MWAVKYVTFQVLVYAIGQFLILCVAWHQIESSPANQTRINLSLIIVCSLPVLPLLRRLRKSKFQLFQTLLHFFVTISFLAGILILEFIIGKRFILVPCVMLNLLLRVVMGDSFLATFALFIGYAGSSPLITTSFSIEALIPILSMLALLGVLLGLGVVWWGLKCRIFQQAKVMRLLKFRHDLELKISQYVIGKKMVGKPVDNPNGSGSIQEKMLRDAVSLDLISLPHEYSNDSVHTRSAERHLTAIIVVKQCVTAEHDSIQNIQNRAYIHKFLDELSTIHKITAVRKFRGLWVGSLGYFDTWEQSRLNSCHVVQMASEVVLLSRRFGWELSAAIDQGSIIGGYIGELMNFDMLGPEVKWAMSAVDETHIPHEICVSPAVRNALLSNAVLNSGIFPVDVTFRTIKTKMTDSETIYVIDNSHELVRRTLDEIYSVHNKLSLDDEAPIDWGLVQRVWHSDSLGLFPLNKPWEQQAAHDLDVDDSIDFSVVDQQMPAPTQPIPLSQPSIRFGDRIGSISSLGSANAVSLSAKNEFKLRRAAEGIRTEDGRQAESTFSDEHSDVGEFDSHDGDRSNENRSHSSHQKMKFRPVNVEIDTVRPVAESYNKKTRLGFFESPADYVYQKFVSSSVIDAELLDQVERIYFGEIQIREMYIDGNLGEGSPSSSTGSAASLTISSSKEISMKAGSLTCKHLRSQILQWDSFHEIFAGIPAELKELLTCAPDEVPVDAVEINDSLPNPFSVAVTLLKELPLVFLGSIVNVGSSSWAIIFYLFFNERFHVEDHRTLVWLGGRISATLAKFSGSKIHPSIPSQRESNTVGDSVFFAEGIMSNSHSSGLYSGSSRRVANRRISSDSSRVSRDMSTPNMKEPSTRDGQGLRKPEKVSVLKPLQLYSDDTRKRIGSSLLPLTWFLSLTSMILAIHININSVGSQNNSFFSFQYMGIIYIITALLFYEQTMEKKTFYFVGLFARLLLVLFFPLYLETSYKEYTTINVSDSEGRGTRHVNPLYLVFVHILLGTFVRPLKYTYLECLVIVGGIFIRYPLLDGHEQRLFSLEERLQLVSFFVSFAYISNVMLEYYTTLCFVLEGVLVPHATTLMQQQHETTRSVLSIFIPSVSPDISIKLMNQKRYGNCAVITMHVKPYQTLPSLVNAREAAAFLLLFHRMLDSCFEECGFIRVCRFSGIFIAVTSDDADFGQPLAKTYQNSTCRRRALYCAKYVQKQLESFNRTYKVNTAVGVSIMSGALALGSTDSSDVALNVSGNVVCIGSILAVREADNIVVDDTFLTEARKTVSLHTKKFSDILPGYRVPTKFHSLVLEDGSFGGQGRKLNDFTYIAMLGRGGYGSVHLVNDKYGIKYAIKCIPKRKGGAASDIMITREFLILTQMKHPNVMALKYCIMSEACVYLVMEYVRGGNLKQIIEKYNPDLNTMTLWFAELVLAIEYVHSLGIQHRDVKPVNCMIHTDGHLKLGDFGLAKIVREDVLNVTGTTAVVSETSDTDEDSGDQIFQAISIMQKVLPIRHHTTHVEGAQVSGLIQAVVFDSDVVRGLQTCSTLKNMMMEAVYYETTADRWKLFDEPQSSVDLILLDLGPDVLEKEWVLFKELRTRSNSESIPLIALSAYDITSLEDKAIELGAKMIINHPLDVNYHRDAIFSYGMIRRQWRYEEVGDDTAAPRQMLSSGGSLIHRYKNQGRGSKFSSPQKFNSMTAKQSSPSGNVRTPPSSVFPSSEIAKNLGKTPPTDPAIVCRSSVLTPTRHTVTEDLTVRTTATPSAVTTNLHPKWRSSKLLVGTFERDLRVDVDLAATFDEATGESRVLQAMVIDSDVERGLQTCTVLKNLGIKILFHECNEGFWNLITGAQFSVDLIFISLGSNPDSVEWHLLRNLNIRLNSESVPIIGLLTHDLEALSEKAFDDGVQSIIQLPFDTDLLRETIFRYGNIKQQFQQYKAKEHATVNTGSGGDIQSSGVESARAMFRSVATVKRASGAFLAQGNFAAFTGVKAVKRVPNQASQHDEVPGSAASDEEKKTDDKKPVGELNSAVGTAHFMAPEIITDRIYDKSVDWWACGVTFYYCVTKNHLFRGSDPNAIFRNILKEEPDLSKLDTISLNLKSLIAGLLEKDYKKRFGYTSTKEIKEHPFFEPGFESVCKRSPTLQPQQLEEVAVSQADKEAGEELFFNRKHLKKKVRVTATNSFSTNASGNLSTSKKHKSGSLGKKSKKISNMKRFNRVANSIKDYSIAEADEDERSEEDNNESDMHIIENSRSGRSCVPKSNHSDVAGPPLEAGGT